MKTISLIMVFFILQACDTRIEQKKICLTAEIITIIYKTPFEFQDSDTLYIDNLKFSHSYFADSIKNRNLLPKEKLVFFEVKKKQAYSKSNSISIGRILASKLKNTGKYKILNGPELITTGLLKIQKNNGKPIRICTTENYLASINTIVK